jgi:glycosyltransferase involved in cell wall biosynthesis
VGAATGKMISVAKALTSAGRKATIISLLPAKASWAKPWFSTRLMHGDGVPVVFISCTQSNVLRKIFGPIILACVAGRIIRRHDKVIFYNHALEYLPTLLFLRFRGIPFYQDVEDIPTPQDTGIRGLIDRAAFRLMLKLSEPKKVTVSYQVAERLKIPCFMPIHGVVLAADRRDVERESGEAWASLSSNGPLRVHYGGSIEKRTGLQIFCDAISHLQRDDHHLLRSIELIVTGVGDLETIRKLAAALRSEKVRILVMGALPPAAYKSVLNSSHASLILKLPDDPISQTTFPSKAIEIAAAGRAIISTRVSDLPRIFDDDAIWFLPEATGSALAQILRSAANSPETVVSRAKRAQALVKQHYAAKRIGQKLTNFLDTEGRQ